MMRPIVTEEPIKDRIIPNHCEYPCFIEFNKSGTRIRIAFDGDDLEGALTRIDECLGVRAFGINAFMAHCEKLAAESKK